MKNGNQKITGFINSIHSFNLSQMTDGVSVTEVTSNGGLKEVRKTYKDVFAKERNVDGIATFQASEKPDDEIYRHLITSIYLAGSKSTIVHRKAKQIFEAYYNCNLKKVALSAEKDIHSRIAQVWKPGVKSQGSLEGARKLHKAKEEYGSVKSWIAQAQDIEKPNDARLKLLDNITGLQLRSKLNFLMVIGIEDVKPDIHLLRILKRWGCPISSSQKDKPTETEILKGREIIWGWRKSNVTQYKVPQIDWILWNFAADSGYTKKAICTKTPNCKECPISRECPKLI